MTKYLEEAKQFLKLDIMRSEHYMLCNALVSSHDYDSAEYY